MAAKKGSSVLITPSMDIPTTLHPVKRITPTGGVMVPIHRLNTIMMPNCTGSMPKLWQMGRKIGVKISTAGVGSIKVPTTRRITFISSRITYLLLLRDSMALAMAVGIIQIDTYFDMNVVEASDLKYSWTLEELAKLPVNWYGGADLSKLHDLTGVCLYGRYRDVDICITHAFIPIAVAHLKADEDNIPFFWWEEEGWLTTCNSDVIEYEDVVKWFIEMKEMGFKIKWVGYDRRYSREFILKMKKAGFKIRDQLQKYVEKTEAFREIEKKYTLKKFYYLHNKAYEYCVSNVKAIEDSDEFVRFQKVMPTQRIDLFDASVIACKQLLIAGEKSSNASMYLD